MLDVLVSWYRCPQIRTLHLSNRESRRLSRIITYRHAVPSLMAAACMMLLGKFSSFIVAKLSVLLLPANVGAATASAFGIVGRGIILAPLGVWMLLVLYRLRQRMWWTTLWNEGHPICPQCGYLLRGLSQPEACPECGRDLQGRRLAATTQAIPEKNSAASTQSNPDFGETRSRNAHN